MKSVDSYQAISMKEFLEAYANLDNTLTDEIINKLETSKATHHDLTLLGIPYIKRIPYEQVDQDDISMGNVILVNDFKGSNKRPRVAPYIRPSLVKQQEEENKKRILQ